MSAPPRLRGALPAVAAAAGLAVATVCLAPAAVGRAAETPLRPVAFVPLDDRPVARQLPILFGRIAGIPVLTPPRATVGSYLVPGDRDALTAWLRGDETRDAAAFVVSLDMLAYGGLVASRTPETSTADALGRLRDFARLRRDRPTAELVGFGTIMRLAPTGVPAIGPARTAWATGTAVAEIQEYANLPDPPRAPAEVARATALRRAIGPRLLGRYLGARARNLAVDRYALQQVAEGGLDRLVLGQDDAGPVGLHLQDVAALDRDVRAYRIANRASVEPGADELGMVLVGRAFAREIGWSPRIRVVYSRPDGGAVVDHLEYVPVDATIGKLIWGVGGRRVDEAPDLDLFVRVPRTGEADERAFEDRLVADVAAGRGVAVGDLSFLADGTPSEPQQELTKALIRRGVAGKIDAFASWNTNANTMGTALGAAVSAQVGKRTGRFDARAHAQFMLDRYADDYAFHQFVRPVLNATLRGEGFDTTLLLPEPAAQAARENRRLLWPQTLALLASIYPGARDAGLTITLPWDRTFETELDVRLDPP